MPTRSPPIRSAHLPALDDDDACLNQPTHLLVAMDNYNAEAKLFVNGKLVQTETIYCNLNIWQPKDGGLALGGDPEPWVDPYELSKMGGFKGTIYSFKMQRNRMSDDALAEYADAAAVKLR